MNTNKKLKYTTRGDKEIEANILKIKKRRMELSLRLPIRDLTYRELQEVIKAAVRDEFSYDFLALRRDTSKRGADDLCNIIMPFGKYNGRRLYSIPLCYLDKTISEMKPSWIVRRVAEFIDLVMDRAIQIHEIAENHGKTYDVLSVPNLTYSEFAERLNKLEEDL